jgi:NADPH:quinone reductase-like Zn-dependent oxidoreductase/NADP-dependent 3-hydroxy acid dehydrogenase YdfG/acyl carrier protein
LQTIQALTPGVVERYYVVTRGAETIAPDDPAPSLRLAAMLGLARTVMTERPDLRFTVVDLPMPDGVAPAQPIGQLVVWLLSLPDEQELAWRGDQLYAARLLPEDRSPRGDDRQLIAASAAPAYALEVREPGKLDTLRFAAGPRRGPGPGELEIEVELAALAFKDVMKALGLLSDGIKRNSYFGTGVGMDGVGRIAAIGAGVDGFTVGDRVYAMARSFMSSHAIAVPADVYKLPPELPSEHAMNVINFITARQALVNIARLQPGERLLVHAAAGGVGLAAIEIARACGAEVIATAGSEPKKAFLHSIGVDHVASSRDVSFADRVMEWTSGQGVDVVLSFSPGEIVAKSVACLAPFGRFIEIGKMSFEHDAPLHLRPFHENLTYAALDVDRMLASRPHQVRALAVEVLARLASGEYRATPTQTVAASDVAEAFRTMSRGQHIGKLCIAARDPGLRVSAAPRSQLAADATYLVTGGLRGFGLEVAKWLVSRGARHLALVTRSGVSTPEARAAIDELHAQGVAVRAFAADIADPEALAGVLAELRRDLPPLRGVVHAATVYDDRSLDSLDRASLESVMRAKAKGAWNLHAATTGDPLELFVLFSSVSSWIGNAGQANYVAANAFLDQLARDRRQRGLPAIAISWGALADAGAVARDRALALHLERLGVRGISTNDALAALGRALDSEHVQVGVIDADWQRLSTALDPWAGRRRLDVLAGHASAGSSVAGRADAKARWATLGDDEAQAGIVAMLRSIVAKVTRSGSRELDPALPLREMGLDSLLALEIAAEIETEIGINIPVMVVAAGPSLDQLATSIRNQAAGSAA